MGEGAAANDIGVLYCCAPPNVHMNGVTVPAAYAVRARAPTNPAVYSLSNLCCLFLKQSIIGARQPGLRVGRRYKMISRAAVHSLPIYVNPCC